MPTYCSRPPTIPHHRSPRLWQLSGVVLLSSAYAIQEARQNLAVHRPNRLGEFEHLVGKLSLLDAPPTMTAAAGAAGLPEKDLPILLAAIGAKATHLLTVDKKHFGSLYGQTIDGVSGDDSRRLPAAAVRSKTNRQPGRG